MAKVNDFEAEDRVIWFSDRNTGPRRPVIAWVSDARWYPSSYEDFVRVSRHKEDAKGGRGIIQHVQNVYHFTDELWRSCEAWYDREMQQMKDLKKLGKGKVV